MSSMSSKCLPKNISLIFSNKRSHWGYIRWIGKVSQYIYFFTSKNSLRGSAPIQAPTVSRRHTKTHSDNDRRHSETAIGQQQHSCETLTCQRHQTIQRFLYTAATRITRWRVREFYCQISCSKAELPRYTGCCIIVSNIPIQIVSWRIVVAMTYALWDKKSPKEFSSTNWQLFSVNFNWQFFLI
jgi:hypothetical protein